jgi:hypothetical protein
MALPYAARALAAEIKSQDWSDSPYRADGARHNRDSDSPSKRGAKQLTHNETEHVRINVIWVTAQAFLATEPDFDIREYATAAGADLSPGMFVNNRDGKPSGALLAGLRFPAAEG